MVRIRGDNQAFGWPGLEPRWTHGDKGDKDGIGTASGNVKCIEAASVSGK
jgi:hypothetical protein